jgi:hypothetical protein
MRKGTNGQVNGIVWIMRPSAESFSPQAKKFLIILLILSK